jgi:hypothetical protein
MMLGGTGVLVQFMLGHRKVTLLHVWMVPRMQEKNQKSDGWVAIFLSCPDRCPSRGRSGPEWQATFFKILDRTRHLSMMARSSRQLPVLHGPKFAAHGLLGDHDAELLPDPLTQIDEPSPDDHHGWLAWIRARRLPQAPPAAHRSVAMACLAPYRGDVVGGGGPLLTDPTFVTKHNVAEVAKLAKQGTR